MASVNTPAIWNAAPLVRGSGPGRRDGFGKPVGHPLESFHDLRETFLVRRCLPGERARPGKKEPEEGEGQEPAAPPACVL